MKKLIFSFALLFLQPSSTPQAADKLKGPAYVSYFFAYDASWQLVFPNALPPTQLPVIPIGPYERPYYAEYSAYYLDTSVSPWRYEPDGYLLQTYWGPEDY